MHLRFFAPLHVCFKTVLGAALLSIVLWPAAQAQQGAQVTQAELQTRLQEAKGNPEVEQRLYSLGQKVAAVCVNCHGSNDGKAILLQQ